MDEEQVKISNYEIIIDKNWLKISKFKGFPPKSVFIQLMYDCIFVFLLSISQNDKSL